MFDKKKSAFFGSIQGMKKMDPLDRSDSSKENCYSRTNTPPPPVRDFSRSVHGGSEY